MIKIISFAFIVFQCSTSQSQILISILLGNKINRDKIELGLDGGYCLSTIVNQDDANFKSSFNLGLYLDLKIKKTKFNYNGNNHTVKKLRFTGRY